MDFVTVFLGGRELHAKGTDMGGHKINNKHLALSNELISRFIIMLTHPNNFSVAKTFLNGETELWENHITCLGPDKLNHFKLCL